MDIYVGNLSFKLAEADIQALFQEFGEVKSVKLVSDKMSGKSKGFGFVAMENDDEGQAAIDKLNGSAIDGRNIVVNQARPKAENASGGGYGGGGANRGGGNRYGGGGGGGRNHGGGYGNRDRGDHRGGGDRDNHYE